MGLETLGAAAGASGGTALGSSAAGGSLLGPLAGLINESPLVAGGAGGIMAPVTTQGLGGAIGGAAGMGAGSTLSGLLGGKPGGTPPPPGPIMQGTIPQVVRPPVAPGIVSSANTMRGPTAGAK
jgi:hypothetical protein